MRSMRTLSVYLVLALLLSMSAWSQSNCEEFKDISERCISNSTKTYSDKPIPIGSLIKDTILFYKTPTGEYGKLKILSVNNKPQEECTVFIDAVTYSNGSAFIPNSSLSIS